MLDVLGDRREAAPESLARREDTVPALLLARSVEAITPHAKRLEAEIGLRVADGLRTHESIATGEETIAYECVEGRDLRGRDNRKQAVLVPFHPTACGGKHIERHCDGLIAQIADVSNPGRLIDVVDDDHVARHAGVERRHRLVGKRRRIEPCDARLAVRERLRQRGRSQLRTTLLRDRRGGADTLGRARQVANLVCPVVPARDVERREVLLLVQKGENTNADAAGDAEQHRFGEWLVRMRRADAGRGEKNAKRRRRRDVSGEMRAGSLGRGFRRIPRRFANDVASRGGVSLAGLLHASANELLEMLMAGHAELLRAGQPDPTRHGAPAFEGRSTETYAADECGATRPRTESPLLPQRRRAWVAGQGVRREQPPTSSWRNRVDRARAPRDVILSSRARDCVKTRIPTRYRKNLRSYIAQEP